jgi:thymidylate synthase (FAD)
MDKRKEILLNRLAQLPIEGVIRIKDNIDKVCFDEYNYNANNNTYCPLAIGLGLDKDRELLPTNEQVGQEIGKVFQPVNALKGVEGEFYTTNRREDLLSVCKEVITPKLKGWTIPVLDHGFVRLIDWMGDDTRITEAARLSYKSPSKGAEQDKKLLQYLWKNKHTSPFEMVKVTFNIKMPIFVMRQYVRHRMQNLNEMSARYTELPNEFYIPKEWRRQDVKNKQGSVTTDVNWDPILFYVQNQPVTATAEFIRHCDSAYRLYEQMLEAGIAREMARMALPINIYTEIYCCWDLKNLFHFIGLRDDGHAQSEIQVFAQPMKFMLRQLFPSSVEAFEKFKFKIVE